MAGKTNAVRIAQQAGIPLEEAFYQYDEADLSGLHAAHALGLPPGQVFKTLVAKGERTGIHVFCIPVDGVLNLKSAARAIGDKSVDLVPVKELLGLTGYIRGGCSPLGMKKKYPTFFDSSCLSFDRIAISAGERGHQMLLPPAPLIQLVNGKVADLTVE